MAESKQDLLRSAWLEGKSGALSGREQAKAWALREVWRDAGKGEYGTGALTKSQNHSRMPNHDSEYGTGACSE